MTLTLGRRVGSHLPLFGTPRSLDRPTLGPRVTEVSRRLGKPFHPGQQHMVDVALEINPLTGRLAYSRVLVIIGRQQGKTELALPVMTHRCTGFEPELSDWVNGQFGFQLPPPGAQSVLYLAQDTDSARAKWRKVHLPRLKDSDYYFPVPEFSYRLQRNEEGFEWRNGSMWSPGSTTGRKAGTGDTIDLGWMDELWSHRDASAALGLRPTMLTRHWRQLWQVSMVPGPSRLAKSAPGTGSYLKAQREVARARVAAGVLEGTAVFDFTAAEGADPGDPATWLSCLPAIGYTVPIGAVAEDFNDLALGDFCAEYLSWWPEDDAVTPTWLVFSRDAWVDLRDEASEIAGRPGLAVEFSEDRQRAWIVAAGYRADGDWHVEVVEPGYLIPSDQVGVDWVERRLVDVYERAEAFGVAVDPSRPAGSLVVPLRNRGLEVLTPSGVEAAGACGRLVDAVVSKRLEGVEAGPVRRLRHRGQLEFEKAWEQAEPYALGKGAFTLVRRGGSGEIGPAYGAVLAMHCVEVLGVEDYDVLDSVDASRRCVGCGLSVYPVGDRWLHAEDDSTECERG